MRRARRSGSVGTVVAVRRGRGEGGEAGGEGDEVGRGADLVLEGGVCACVRVKSFVAREW